jgi:hypothetical protein
LTVSEVGLAALTLVAVPLNLTVFEAGVLEKPVPSIVTVVPMSPRSGLSWITDKVEDVCREIERRFPAESQL